MVCVCMSVQVVCVCVCVCVCENVCSCMQSAQMFMQVCITVFSYVFTCKTFGTLKNSLTMDNACQLKKMFVVKAVMAGKNNETAKQF